MTTNTQVILRRPPPAQSRNYDYLYDPLFSLASERDHARQTMQAATSAGRVLRVPVDPNLFSDLPHYPRLLPHMSTTDPIPAHVPRQWPGYVDQARQRLIEYSKFSSVPQSEMLQKRFEDAKVTGVNRSKYFKRPIIPFMQQIAPDVILDTSKVDPLSYGLHTQVEAEAKPSAVFLQAAKAISTQTDYREQEVQTDPYTPEFVVKPGSQPELLTLATLAWGHGLPAGLAEVEMIERARIKRAWEASLPPLDDPSQWEKRQKMSEAMEREEWALREKEIEKLQEKRLAVLKQLLAKREQNNIVIGRRKLDRKWARLQSINEEKISKLRHKFMREVRSLTRKKANVENRLVRRDVVDDYKNSGSQSFAPLTRVGVFIDRNADRYNVQSKFLSSYEGLLEVERSLPQFVTQPRIMAPTRTTHTKEGHLRRKFRIDQELEGGCCTMLRHTKIIRPRSGSQFVASAPSADIYNELQKKRRESQAADKSLRFLQRVPKVIPRPETPVCDVPDLSLEQENLAVVTLQKLVRGRAIQNMIFEGKEKRIELIRELQSTHALQEAEIKLEKMAREQTIALQRQRRTHLHREDMIDEELSHLEANVLADDFDFLSKELERLQEERRIHAFAMLAERQRRIREAEESGRRQIEERRRREEDEIFKQLVKVHQNTVDQYLHDVIGDNVEQVASEQARGEIDDLARKINDVAYEMEANRTKLKSDEIAAEVVHSFFLPEVQRRAVRDKVKDEQRRYLLAAHRIIYDQSKELFESQHAAPVVEQPQSANNNNNAVELPFADSQLATKEERKSAPLSGRRERKGRDLKSAPIIGVVSPQPTPPRSPEEGASVKSQPLTTPADDSTTLDPRSQSARPYQKQGKSKPIVADEQTELFRASIPTDESQPTEIDAGSDADVATKEAEPSEATETLPISARDELTPSAGGGSPLEGAAVPTPASLREEDGGDIEERPLSGRPETPDE